MKFLLKQQCAFLEKYLFCFCKIVPLFVLVGSALYLVCGHMFGVICFFSLRVLFLLCYQKTPTDSGCGPQSEKQGRSSVSYPGLVASLFRLHLSGLHLCLVAIGVLSSGFNRK